MRECVNMSQENRQPDAVTDDGIPFFAERDTQDGPIVRLRTLGYRIDVDPNLPFGQQVQLAHTALKEVLEKGGL